MEQRESQQEVWDNIAEEWHKFKKSQGSEHNRLHNSGNCRVQRLETSNIQY